MTAEITTAPLAHAFGPTDRMVVIQDGVFKVAAPSQILQGAIIGVSPLVIDMTGAAIVGAFVLNVQPAAGCSILVEVSRDNGATYQQIGATAWSTVQTFNYDYGPNDVNYVTQVRLTRATGSLATSRYQLTAGVVALMGTQQDNLGVAQSKALVVDATTRNRWTDPANDPGWLLQSQGIDQNILIIPCQAVNAWDYSRGDRWFAIERISNAACFVDAPRDFGPIASQAAMTAVGPALISAAVIGDFCQRTDITGSPNYVLTTPGPTNAAHWTALGVGVAAAVAINNPGKLELQQDGPALLFKSRAPNIWTVS